MIERGGSMVYAACVDFMLAAAHLAGATYRDANAFLFFVLWPLVTVNSDAGPIISAQTRAPAAGRSNSRFGGERRCRRSQLWVTGRSTPWSFSGNRGLWLNPFASAGGGEGSTGSVAHSDRGSHFPTTTSRETTPRCKPLQPRRLPLKMNSRDEEA